MSNSKRDASLRDLIRSILEASSDAGDKATLREARTFFAKITRLNYRDALRELFDDWQMRELLREMRRSLPDLNHKVFSELRIDRLARRAADLGAILKAEPFAGERGWALRGFYVRADVTSSDPMVYVNTARDPVGVAAAFWHEVGHHLTHQILGESVEGPLYLSFTADYAAHLKSLDELSADIVMTLGCYPRHAAQRVFARKSSRNPRTDRLILSAREYVRRVAGLEFDDSNSVQENIYRLAGMIHLAKLRAALLSEYGI